MIIYPNDSYIFCQIVNSPRGGVRSDEEKDEAEQQQEIELQHGETQDVNRLPPPEPLPCDEYGNQISVRVPPPLARENEPFLINYVRTLHQLINI